MTMPDKKGRPFRELFDHFAEMQRMREYARHPGEAGGERGTPEPAWVPTTDIFAHGDDLVIRCELAGVEPDDVELSLSRGVLLIWGEREPRPDQTQDVSYYVHERRFGAFRRSITLPERVTEDRLHASLENGLLEIVVVDGAAEGEHERIEITRRDPGRVQVDVEPDEGEQ
jgi:HSP20 family protein